MSRLAHPKRNRALPSRGPRPIVTQPRVTQSPPRPPRRLAHSISSPRVYTPLRNLRTVNLMGYLCYNNSGGVARRYYTKEERVAWLKEYQAELENETQAVKERIASVEAE